MKDSNETNVGSVKWSNGNKKHKPDLYGQIVELCHARRLMQTLTMQQPDDRQACLLRINMIEGNIDDNVSNYLNEWKQHSQWQCNQAASSLVDRVGNSCVLETQPYLGNIGCCFTNCHQDLVQIECVPSFDLKPKVFTFELDTHVFICHKRFVNVMKAKLLMHQICQYVQNIAVNEKNDTNLEVLYAQISSARKLLNKINKS